MKILTTIICLFLALATHAQSIVTATVTATSGTANGNTIAVNGTSRLITNSVVNSATQIASSGSITGAIANVFIAYAIVHAPNCDIATVSTNAMTFKSYAGTPMVVTIGGGWATVSYSTNTLTAITAVRVPFSAIGAVEKTNVESGIVDYLNDSLGANIITSNAPFFISYVNTNGNQQISGAKTFNGSINGVVGNLTNGTWTNPSFTNGQNFGNAFRSPGGGIGSEQFGLGATASDDGTSAFGNTASASAVGASAFGATAQASGLFSVALGDGSVANNSSAIAIGFSTASGNSSLAAGTSSTASHSTSSAIGSGATTTAAHQIMMGTSSEFVQFPGNVSFAGVETNLQTAGTTIIGGTVQLTRVNVTGLANGGNNAFSFSGCFAKLSGPTGAFSTAGVTGGVDDRIIYLQNSTSYVWTIPNDSGTATNANDRILTGTGADVTISNNPGFAMLKYDSSLSRWLLMFKSN